MLTLEALTKKIPSFRRLLIRVCKFQYFSTETTKVLVSSYSNTVKFIFFSPISQVAKAQGPDAEQLEAYSKRTQCGVA